MRCRNGKKGRGLKIVADISLLDRTRRLSALLHTTVTPKVVFSDICALMAELLDSRVCTFSKKGKLLGCGGICDAIPELEGMQVGDFLSAEVDRRFLSILSTNENAVPETLGLSNPKDRVPRVLLTPVIMSGERLGTLMIYRIGQAYGIDDIILCEYGATVVSLEMLRSLSSEQEENDRSVRSVQAALDALSPAERTALKALLSELGSGEALIVSSRIAEEHGLTRTVVVNAIRKMESAGVFSAHSAGVKGTRIRVVNDFILTTDI